MSSIFVSLCFKYIEAKSTSLPSGGIEGGFYLYFTFTASPFRTSAI